MADSSTSAGSQVGYQFIRIGTVTLRVAVNQLAERLNMVDLVRRRPHKAMFRVGKMTLRMPPSRRLDKPKQ